MTQPEFIETRIREFLSKTFPLIHKQKLGADENWLESGLIDSLGILDVIHFLEEQFSIQVSDEELLPENFQSLSTLCAFVEMKCRANSAEMDAGNQAVSRAE